MGFFERFVRPKKVQEAVFANDPEKLSAMGKKGGERAADNRAFKESDEKAKLVEAALEQAKTYSVEDGDVLPPDPETIAAIKDQLRRDN